MVGLVPALQGLCGELYNQLGVQVDFVHSELGKPIPMDVRVCVYRVAQEALRNVAKHSSATRARMELMDSVAHLELRITDDGSGFLPESVQGKAGLGLVSMRERLRALGGQLVVQSAPAQGTRIQMRVPLSRS
jgi:signal transduction histidine kinase